MVLLALPPADHLLIERDRGQFVPSRPRGMMADVRAERLLKIPAEPSPELRIPNAAAQRRMVSVAKIRLDRRKSTRLFKGIICLDISEFEFYMPSHAVASLWARQASWIELRFKSPLGPWSERASSSRATFAMISANCVAGRDQGRGIACAFGMPVHWGCNDSVVADYRRIPSGSRGGPI